MGLASWLITTPNWWMLASVCISKRLLEFEYASEVSWAIVRLISSNSFCSTSVHLNFTLGDVSTVIGCNICDRLYHISL